MPSASVEIKPPGWGPHDRLLGSSFSSWPTAYEGRRSHGWTALSDVDLAAVIMGRAG